MPTNTLGPLALVPGAAMTLCGVFQQVNRLEHDLATSLGITPQVSRGLLCLLIEKPCCVRKLTDLLGLRPSSTSKLLSRLESKGFVSRSLDPSDKRMERVELTLAGLEKARQIQERMHWLLSASRNPDEPHAEFLQKSLVQLTRLGDLCASYESVVRQMS